MLHVVEINRVEDLANYQLLWKSLLAETRGATFFQSYDWLVTYWKHFGAQQRLRVLVVYHGDEVVGILPMTIKSEPTRVGKVRVLTYPLHDWGSFYGPIGPHPTATLQLGLNYLANHSPDWDLIDLRWIDGHGCDGGRTRRAMRSAGLQGIMGSWKQVAVIDVATTWDDYLGSRTNRFRSNIRRLLRRAERTGIEYVRHRPPGVAHGDGDPNWDVFENCMELARHSWQGASTDGTTLSHSTVSDFFRDVHEVAAHGGSVDINLIKIDGSPIAFNYNYHYHGCVNGLRMGFDPNYSRHAPGTVLLASMIRDSCQRDDQVLDLGPEYLDVKRRWTTSIDESQRCTHYRKLSPKPQLLRCKHWLARRQLAFT